MSKCQKVEMSKSQKVKMSKCQHVKMSKCQHANMSYFKISKFKILKFSLFFLIGWNLFNWAAIVHHVHVFQNYLILLGTSGFIGDLNCLGWLTFSDEVSFFQSNWNALSVLCYCPTEWSKPGAYIESRSSNVTVRGASPYLLTIRSQRKV